MTVRVPTTIEECLSVLHGNFMFDQRYHPFILRVARIRTKKLDLPSIEDKWIERLDRHNYFNLNGLPFSRRHMLFWSNQQHKWIRDPDDGSLPF